jgi:NAD(P)H dehydrogenase (quinone)
MKISIILAHPNPGASTTPSPARRRTRFAKTATRSFFTTFARNNSRRCSPRRNSGRTRSSIRSWPGTAEEIAVADGIIIVHPNWWGMPPAILKGWIDRVLRPEVAYRFVAKATRAKACRWVCSRRRRRLFSTPPTRRTTRAEIFGDPLETLWKNCVFDLCGVRKVHRRTFAVVVTSTPQQRAAWLAEVRETVEQFFPKRG